MSGQRSRQLRDVRIQIVRGVEHGVRAIHQMAEMQRAPLALVKLRQEHGEHRPVDDRRFDERARVDAHHR